MDNNLEISQEEALEKVGCPAVGYQDVDVCIPITIKAFGEVGNAKTECLGEAHVSSGCAVCAGKPGEECKFTIRQKLRVEVPVIFGARAEAGEASINCGCAEREEGGGEYFMKEQVGNGLEA